MRAITDAHNASNVPNHRRIPRFVCVCVCVRICSFQWQCYVPTLALLVENDLGLPITMVGWLYLAFVGTSIFSSLLLHLHLRFFTPFTLLWVGYAGRLLSGALHAIACWAITPASLPLLLASRVIHGYTILLFPLSVVWIGAREELAVRASTLATRNAYSTFGIFFGIVAGASLSAVLPTSLQAGAAPGWLNIAVSAFMLAWLRRSFADRSMLPTKKPPAKPPTDGGTAAAAPEEEAAPWLHVWLVGFAQFFGWFGFVAIEGSLSIVVEHLYGFTHANVVAVWVPTSAAMLLGTTLFAMLHKRKWRAASIAWIALAALLVGGVSLVAATRLMPSVASGIAIDATLSTVSIACLTGGLGSLLFAFAVTNTLFNGILMQHLRPHQQSAFQTPVQTLGAVGRGIGPYLATLAISYGEQLREGLGAKYMLVLASAAIGLSIAVPSSFGRAFFDPPPPVPTMW